MRGVRNWGSEVHTGVGVSGSRGFRAQEVSNRGLGVGAGPGEPYTGRVRICGHWGLGTSGPGGCQGFGGGGLFRGEGEACGETLLLGHPAAPQAGGEGEGTGGKSPARPQGWGQGWERTWPPGLWVSSPRSPPPPRLTQARPFLGDVPCLPVDDIPPK